LNGFRKSKVLFAATKLKVFDELAKTGPQTAHSLAKSLSLNEPAVSTLLNSCVSLELLCKDKSTDTFFVNDMAQKYLVSSSPDSLVGYIYHSNDVVYNLFSALESSIQTGDTCWKESKLLDADGDTKSAFAQLYKTEESLDRFLRGMHGLSVSCAPALVHSFDLSRFRTLVDLGGGSGALVYEACKHYPTLKGSILDLESALVFTRSSIARQAHSSPHISERISFISGNFFEDDLPDADIFVLSRIIHDWEEDKACKLLKRVYDRLPNKGAVLVCEMLLDEDGCGPTETLLQSLNMLVQTGGKERKFSEYEAILKSVGFVDISCKKTGQYLDAILAIK